MELFYWLWQTDSQNDSQAPSFSLDFKSAYWSIGQGLRSLRSFFDSIVLLPYLRTMYRPRFILDANHFLKKGTYLDLFEAYHISQSSVASG